MYEIHRAQANTVKLCTENTRKKSNNTWLRLWFCPPYRFIFTSVWFSTILFSGQKSFQIFYTTKITKKEIKIRRHKDNDVDDFWFVLWNNFLRLNSVCSRTLHPNVLHGQVNRCYCCHCYCCCFCLVKKWNVSFWRARSLNMWVYALCVCVRPLLCLSVCMCAPYKTLFTVSYSVSNAVQREVVRLFSGFKSPYKSLKSAVHLNQMSQLQKRKTCRRAWFCDSTTYNRIINLWTKVHIYIQWTLHPSLMHVKV